MHSTTGRGRDCQSLDSAVLANKESASTRSAISVPQGWGLIRTEFSGGTGGEHLALFLFLGWKLFRLAQASSNVPSTVKCSSEAHPCPRACSTISARNS